VVRLLNPKPGAQPAARKLAGELADLTGERWPVANNASSSRGIIAVREKNLCLPDDEDDDLWR